MEESTQVQKLTAFSNDCNLVKQIIGASINDKSDDFSNAFTRILSKCRISWSLIDLPEKKKHLKK